MSVLVGRSTRLMVQGLGTEGQNQIRRSLAYGTTVVAGVHPSFRGGAEFEGFRSSTPPRRRSPRPNRT